MVAVSLRIERGDRDDFTRRKHHRYSKFDSNSKPPRSATDWKTAIRFTARGRGYHRPRLLLRWVVHTHRRWYLARRTSRTSSRFQALSITNGRMSRRRNRKVAEVILAASPIATSTVDWKTPPNLLHIERYDSVLWRQPRRTAIATRCLLHFAWGVA